MKRLKGAQIFGVALLAVPSILARLGLLALGVPLTLKIARAIFGVHF